MKNTSILTERELITINKKISNKKLTQQDSNYLSRFVRPKLRKIINIDAESLLKRLEYNPKSRIIERKVKKYILDNIQGVKCIILYGSAITSGYTEYKDIDILVITKEKLYQNSWRKNEILNELEKKAEELNLKLDIQIIDEYTIKNSYSSNISLIYQLKDSKIIYGSIKLPKKIEIPKINIKMKLDWSELDNPSGEEIYNCIRNTLLVRLLMNKIVDNNSLSKSLISELGRNLIYKLKENTASKIEKKMAVEYLNNLNNLTLNEIKEAKWEKIVI